MPAKKERREHVFVRLFVSAYENFTWIGSPIDHLDEKYDGAVEALVTRADGETMAIEYTLIQPFVNEIDDFIKFEPVFRRIADDQSLAVPYTGISVATGLPLVLAHDSCSKLVQLKKHLVNVSFVKP